MIREAENGGPSTADVHPDEVDNYRKGGWIAAPKAPEAPEPPQGDNGKKKGNRKAPEAPETGSN